MSGQTPPLLLIGCHRSGTSLLAGLLRASGVFMGAKRNPHEEAFFFLRTNQEIFRIAHAEWDNPEPVKYLLAAPAMRGALIQRLRQEIRSWKMREYWGILLNLKSRWFGVHQPWGWKDPRNSYTLPIWHELFGETKIIHLYRNGIDVASSLRARELRRAHPLESRAFSCRCLTLEGAFGLWAEYETMCLEATKDLPGDRLLRIRYEDLLRDADSHLRRLTEFVGVPLSPAAFESTTIDPARGDAFLVNEELRRFYEQNRGHPLMKLYGYDSLGEREGAVLDA